MVYFPQCGIVKCTLSGHPGAMQIYRVGEQAFTTEGQTSTTLNWSVADIRKNMHIFLQLLI